MWVLIQKGTGQSPSYATLATWPYIKCLPCLTTGKLGEGRTLAQNYTAQSVVEQKFKPRFSIMANGKIVEQITIVMLWLLLLLLLLFGVLF